MQLIIKSINSIQETAMEFLKQIGDKKVIAFYGEMGVGKTTFVKALCKELNVVDQVSSPTFALVNEYRIQDQDSIFHFDFYRIENIEEVYDFGYEEYFYSGKLCLIEWPEMINEILPENCLEVKITENLDKSRTLEF